MSDPAKNIFIVSETVWQSIGKDTFSMLCIVVVIGVGALLKSSAMQWAGFVLLAVGFLGRVDSHEYRVTPQRAADLLHERFGVVAKADSRAPGGEP